MLVGFKYTRKTSFKRNSQDLWYNSQLSLTHLSLERKKILTERERKLTCKVIFSAFMENLNVQLLFNLLKSSFLLYTQCLIVHTLRDQPSKQFTCSDMNHYWPMYLPFKKNPKQTNISILVTGFLTALGEFLSIHTLIYTICNLLVL